MDDVLYIVLADGVDEKMKSGRHTVLHEACGRKLLTWTLGSVRECAGPENILVVTGFDEENVRACAGNARCVNRESLGEVLKNRPGRAVMLSGAMPLIKADTLRLLEQTARDGCASHLVYDGEDGEETRCRAFCAPCEALAKGDPWEAIGALRRAGKVVDVVAGELECMQVKDRASLWNCCYVLQGRILAAHMDNGVTFRDPTATYVDADVCIGMDTVVMPGVMLTGSTSIGKNCVLSGACRLHDTVVGDNCALQDVVGNRAVVEDGVTIGPFVNLRPDTHVDAGARIGDFVEIKNSNIGAGSKVPHLSYVGDSDVGKRVNVGCGCVFVNYDGFKKHRTVVGDDVFLGCQTNLVAPVKVGNDAFTAAGSTVTEDVPEGALAIARNRQVNKAGWVKIYRQLKTGK